jgi:hypothetical protein
MRAYRARLAHPRGFRDALTLFPPSVEWGLSIAKSIAAGRYPFMGTRMAGDRAGRVLGLSALWGLSFWSLRHVLESSIGAALTVRDTEP